MGDKITDFGKMNFKDLQALPIVTQECPCCKNGCNFQRFAYWEKEKRIFECTAEKNYFDECKRW